MMPSLQSNKRNFDGGNRQQMRRGRSPDAGRGRRVYRSRSRDNRNRSLSQDEEDQNENSRDNKGGALRQKLSERGAH